MTWTYFLPTLGVESNIGVCCADSGVVGQENSKRPKEDMRRRLLTRFTAFPLPCRAYEVLPEIGVCFEQRIGERMSRLLNWLAQKQPQHRTYDAFFKNVQGFNDGLACGGRGEDETFRNDDGDGQSGGDRDSDDTEDTVKGANDRSSDGEDTRRGQTAGGTTAAAATPVDTEARLSGRLSQDVNGGHMDPCPGEQDM
ncbi:Hypothetical predicted protein [Olea europaea subsp. europaea]|uniref:Uncharacterized protein n=1 Tax=Olea europaea subsp. europaea TaxID=158383 RepID=A0A8S0RZ55_OLEEU|nr:Hypothetical predicted protein [Olea europaea subsp. europaea]